MRLDDIWHMKRLNFFPAIAEHDLEALLRDNPLQKFKKGEPIYLTGQSANYLYLLKEGYVRISRLTPEGRSLILDILNPGDVFGEMALAGIDRRNESADAMQDCTICPVPIPVMAGLLEQNSAMALQLFKIIGFRRQMIEMKIESLIFCTVPVRLARMLLMLAERYPGRTQKGFRYVKLRITHREMGELIGANREIVTASLNKLKHDGLLSFVRKYIVLLDEEALAALAGNEVAMPAPEPALAG